MTVASNRKLYIVVSLIAALAAAGMIFVISSKYGLALSPDSACYFSIAENILKGNGYARYDLEPAVAWPPLYPTLLALAGILKIPFTVWALILNSVLTGLIVFFSAKWFFRKLSSFTIALTGVIGVLLSLPLIYCASYAWSETLFIFLVLLFLIKLENYCTNRTLKNVFILSLLAALACLTRYAGVTLIFFYLLWSLPVRVELKEKLKHSLLFLLVSLVPLILWFARNYAITSTLTGERGEAVTSLFKNLAYTADTISIWFLPIQVPVVARIIIVGVLLMLGLAFYLKKKFTKDDHDSIPQALIINGGYVLVYVGYIIIVSSLVAFDQIYHRFLAPVYIPLIFSILFAVNRTISLTESRKIWSRLVLTLLAIFWISYLSYNVFDQIKVGLKEGAGSYASDEWQHSQFAKFLRENPPQYKTFSNFPDAIYLFSGLPASMAPRKHLYRSTDKASDDVIKLQAVVKKAGHVSLAWFSQSNRGFLFTPEELPAYFEVTVANILADGILYTLSPKQP